VKIEIAIEIGIGSRIGIRKRPLEAKSKPLAVFDFEKIDFDCDPDSDFDES